MDTHDVARGRFDSVSEALAALPQLALVLGIESDRLFTFAEQQELREVLVPNGRLEKITSPGGHDGFLLEFDPIDRYVMGFVKEALPEIMDSEGSEEKGED